jgi:hypothetical protein
MFPDSLAHSDYNHYSLHILYSKIVRIHLLRDRTVVIDTKFHLMVPCAIFNHSTHVNRPTVWIRFDL